MNWWKALGYISHVVRAGNAILMYMKDKKEGKLASELSKAIYDATDQITKGKTQKKVSRDKAVIAARALADLIKDAVG